MKHLLDESRAFDPKAVTILLKAFDGVVADLDLQTRAEREQAAKIVMGLATGQTDLDAAVLRADAVATIRDESGTGGGAPPAADQAGGRNQFA